MREAYHPPRWTTIIIFVLIGAFVLQSVLWFYEDFEASRWLAMSVAGLSKGRLWQLFTFQFLHTIPWPWHVLFNCLGLYFFGRPVEESLGGRRFLLFYFSAGLAGGVLQALLTVLLPRHLDIPVVGASAGVCGLIAFYCTRNPMQELTTWLYFLPITIRARYLLIFLGGFSLFGALVPFDSIAHGAHLGGIALGIAYARLGGNLWGRFPRWGLLRSRRRKQELVQAASLRGRPWREDKTEPLRDTPAEEFISKKVDPILDKISAQGIQSLTERDRRILEAARKRMGKG